MSATSGIPSAARHKADRKGLYGEKHLLETPPRVPGLPLRNLASTKAADEIPAEDRLLEGLRGCHIFLVPAEVPCIMTVPCIRGMSPVYNGQSTLHAVQCIFARNQDVRTRTSLHATSTVYARMVLTPVIQHASHRGQKQTQLRKDISPLIRAQTGLSNQHTCILVSSTDWFSLSLSLTPYILAEPVPSFLPTSSPRNKYSYRFPYTLYTEIKNSHPSSILLSAMPFNRPSFATALTQTSKTKEAAQCAGLFLLLFRLVLKLEGLFPLYGVPVLRNDVLDNF
ncbi:hypothetical protein V8C42DRAFT_101371 [Trichoderma barbatum]